VVPGTHKSNMKSPHGNNPDEEPGMIGLPVEAGDAILFTEHLRHGGLTNRRRVKWQIKTTAHRVFHSAAITGMPTQARRCGASRMCMPT
jgi:ectoine hydroxylase-related dioxygenase (phytanoyl-CoA dioxygenase family)